jgi:hypothetical protein
MHKQRALRAARIWGRQGIADALPSVRLSSLNITFVRIAGKKFCKCAAGHLRPPR